MKLKWINKGKAGGGIMAILKGFRAFANRVLGYWGYRVGYGIIK